MPSSAWTAADIPDQTGRVFVITGANSGLGAETTRALAEHGATVLMACRDTTKGERIAAEIGGEVSVRPLDLASLDSVRRFAARVETVDVLINNAGIMAVPKSRTADGFEAQLGTNFLGHFALTGLLLPRVRRRVVTLSSNAHKFGRIDLADLNWRTRRYRRWQAYGQSKLADLMLALELDRRLRAADAPVLSVAAHPGYSSTGLTSHTESLQSALMSIGDRLVAQNASMGALPTLYAATMPDVHGGEYFGPSGPGEWRGNPVQVSPNGRARDEGQAAKLWGQAEALTGVSFGSI